MISVGYGVSILTSPKKRIWGYLFLFNGTSYEKVLEATIKDNTVYAITGK